MEPEAEAAEPSFLERLVSSRNRDLSLFLPILLGLANSTNPSEDSAEPDVEESLDSPSSGEPRGRIILINPMTQGMVVIEGSSSRLDSLVRDLLISKDGQPPASKPSIEAMPSVEIGEGESGNGCVICLDEWEIGAAAKEMPCKHRFHGDCIEKWLGIHGTCPVCRYKMPVEDGDDGKKLGGDDDEDDERESGRRRRRREIWVSLSFSRDRRDVDSDSDLDSNSNLNETASSDSSTNPSRSAPRSGDEMEE